MASSQCAESNEFISPTDASALAPGDSLNITFPIYEGFLVTGDHRSTVVPEIRVLASLVADSGEQLETIFDTTFNTTTYTAIEGTGTTAKASWIQLDNGCANHTSALQFIWRVPNTILESRSAGSFHVSILPDWIGTATSSEPFTILSNSALSADAATTTTTIAGSAATPPHHDAHRSTIFGTSSDDDAGSTLPGQSDTTSLRGGLLGVAIIVPLLVVIVLGTCGTCCWLRRRRGDRSNTGERFRFKKSTFSSTQGSTLLSNASRNDERGGAAAADDRRDRAMSLELARFDSPRPQAAHTRHRPR